MRLCLLGSDVRSSSLVGKGAIRFFSVTHFDASRCSHPAMYPFGRVLLDGECFPTPRSRGRRTSRWGCLSRNALAFILVHHQRPIFTWCRSKPKVSTDHIFRPLLADPDSDYWIVLRVFQPNVSFIAIFHFTVHPPIFIHTYATTDDMTERTARGRVPQCGEAFVPFNVCTLQVLAQMYSVWRVKPLKGVVDCFVTAELPAHVPKGQRLAGLAGRHRGGAFVDLIVIAVPSLQNRLTVHVCGDECKKQWRVKVVVTCRKEGPTKLPLVSQRQDARRRFRHIFIYSVSV